MSRRLRRAQPSLSSNRRCYPLPSRDMPPSPCFLLSSTALLTRPPRHPASPISVRLSASSQFGITATMLDSAQHRRRAQRVRLDPPWSPLLLRHQAALQAVAVTKPVLCLDLVAPPASQSLPASTSLSLSSSLPAVEKLRKKKLEARDARLHEGAEMRERLHEMRSLS
ncbi:hypothetical protein M0R45_002604 [Rubus argutus]|uniref:Uncharacterized protein n=1 Tax=Rubus argutus TaxID=59490 RepID=A0AAW1VRY6_RUBAR